FLDRNLQRLILNTLAANYPDRTTESQLKELGSQGDVTKSLLYLSEHGLITGGATRSNQGWHITAATITAHGLDIAEDDGGLSAPG
ncbi:hypothetical protein, partial [Leisingera sp.]|uniref:hypothetical protein n=1 Tax=Leisingera sp. TaxID=1879318 RepID=UPI002B264FA9